MSLPAGVITRNIQFAIPFDLIDGTSLTMRVTLRPTRSLAWRATGQPAIGRPYIKISSGAALTTFPVPITSQAGVWDDLAGNHVEPDAENQTHGYDLGVEFLSGTKVVSSTGIITIAVPAGSTPIDIAKVLPVDGGGGTTIYVPDVYGSLLAAANAAAAAAQAQVAALGVQNTAQMEEFEERADDKIELANAAADRAEAATAITIPDDFLADMVDTPGSATDEALRRYYAARQTPPTTALAAGLYDRRLNVYNLKPRHLRRARARLAAAKAGVGEVTCAWVGDSTVAGVGATVATTSLPAQFAALLAARGVPFSTSGFVAGSNGTITDSRLVKTGTWGQRSGDACMAFTVTAGDYATFTFPATDGIQLSLFYGNKSTAFTVQVDGGAAVTVTPTNAETLGIWTSAPLSVGAHTLKVMLTAGTGARLEILGAEQRRSATGMRLLNLGVGSTKISALAATGTNWFKNGQLPVAATPNGFAADLVFIDMEINDAAPGSATAVATYKATYQTAITNLRANGADVVLMICNPCNGYDFTDYTKAIYELADSNDLPVIDIQDRWGTWALANSYSNMNDALHPNQSGYLEKASAIVTALALV